jgi:hypothetical protein
VVNENRSILLHNDAKIDGFLPQLNSNQPDE